VSSIQDLTGKAAIVTGASRNLGRGIAELIARRGADVMVHFGSDRSRAEAEQTAQAIRAVGVRAEIAQADLAESSQVLALVDQCFARFGRLDVLVNNAGVIVKKPFGEITDADFERCFAINARAPFLLMRAAASRMGEGGRIVNIATSVLACSFPYYGVYAGSKATLEHFSRALAKELASKRISVNTIAPGALDTPFFYAAETDESVAAIRQFTGGLGRVEDVLPMIDALLRPDASWMSGQTIFVNGGFAAR
jgi:NAD(P)-dependent dehydrogenase (short-subunit alcohol dehydrogenase family)